MNAVNGFKIFMMNDCDWWLAPTREEAIEDAKLTYGDEPEYWEGAEELTETQLDKLLFTEEDGSKSSFRETLARRAEAGLKTEMFASTEY